MPLKKVSSKEFIKIVKQNGLDLSMSYTTFHVGLYHEWDFKKKDYKKPKLILTKRTKERKKG